MNLLHKQRFPITQAIWVLAFSALSTFGALPSTDSNHVVSVLLTNGLVEVSRTNLPLWSRASVVAPDHLLRPGDRLRTGDRSRTAVLLADRTIKQMGPSSLMAVLPPKAATSRVGLLQGVFHFFHRDDPGEVEAESPSVSMVIRGTEFHVEVRPDGTTLVQLFDGRVDLHNAVGDLQLQGRDGAIVRPGQRPERAPVLFANQVIQWALYYPALLSEEELNLGPAVAQVLQGSLKNYSQGDLIQAIAIYPADRVPDNDSERLYFAALLLSVGEVAGANTSLDGLKAPNANEQRIRAALRSLISTSQGVEEPGPPLDRPSPTLAVEWMAESYRLQSLRNTRGSKGTNSLLAALFAAKQAVLVRPSFGFSWIRRAELEFSTGDRRSAMSSLVHGLVLSPRHAHAAALRGFILAAENRPREALHEFERAIEWEPHLASAWLGRGLIRIRRGDREAGMVDLEVAAALEPQRSVLRSYLGKALADAGDLPRARRELELARAFDPNDPTSWLYQALLDEKENRINSAIRELETAVRLNGNRALYRSQLSLDQDRAVQGANLARIYSDAGMPDVALHEAGRAAQRDYASPGARLFLAQAYDALRDPRQVQLRYETPWLNEYLMANLLSPVGAGSLSPYVSAQEFSKLFERDRVGLVSRTEYLSRGDWHQVGVQHGTFGRTAYAIEADGLWERGHYGNGEREALTLRARVKQELSPSDRLYLEVTRYDETSGDISQHLDPSQVNNGLRLRELQNPTVLIGWTHEWDASSRTLVLFSHLDDLYHVRNPLHSTAITLRDATTRQILDVLPVRLDQSYESQLAAWSGEIQHIKQASWLTWIVGARFQTGSFDSRGHQEDSQGNFLFFPPTFLEAVSSPLERITGYAWGYWELDSSLVAISGLSWDQLRFPANHRYSPLSSAAESRQRLSPKLGWVWSPSPHTTLRGAWWRSLGGVSLEQSYQLEPTQTAGFVHAYRSLIPESVAGSSAAPKQEGASVAWDQSHDCGLYYGVQLDWLTSRADRDRGVFEFEPLLLDVTPDVLREQLDFSERGIGTYIYRRLGEQWMIGGTYRFSRAELEDVFQGVPNPTAGGFVAGDRIRGTLQTARLMTRFRHSSGFFSGFETTWYSQSMASGELEDIWQSNVEAGWRFARRALEIRVALLNLTDRDYRLHPLNSLNEFPRERTLALGMRWQF